MASGLGLGPGLHDTMRQGTKTMTSEKQSYLNGVNEKGWLNYEKQQLVLALG